MPGVWRRESGAWIEMPIPEVVVPDVEGLALTPTLGSVRVADSAVLVTVVLRNESIFDPGFSPFIAYYGQNIDVVGTADFGPLEVHVDGAEEVAATITVEVVDGQPPIIEFRDSDSNELVHTVQATLPGMTNSPASMVSCWHSWEERNRLSGGRQTVGLGSASCRKPSTPL